jgi:hypothetical protein
MFKFFNRRRQKGQSTLEYAILIIIIIGALLSIQIYIRRGIQGRFKDSADQIGDQFSPGNTNVVKITKTTSYNKETFSSGVQSTVLLNDEVTNATMDSDIMVMNREYWGK